ncbi:hypothetical protein [Nocardia sp. NPDC057440]|uniref:hypothetical protein n=1 Tax=Nocardia sp. NPDC057440 TaxID=3346134 RepID=UPI003671F7BF
MADIPPDLIADTRAFLANIARTDDEARLRRDVELWKNSSDLNEEYLAQISLAALLLLKRWDAAKPTEEKP